MLMQITGLLLVFAVEETDGKFELKLESCERIFPAIFCRQLDHVQTSGTNIIVVQDTPDEAKFEAFSIDTSKLRNDGVNKLHLKHFFNQTEN